MRTVCAVAAVCAALFLSTEGAFNSEYYDWWSTLAKYSKDFDTLLDSNPYDYYNKLWNIGDCSEDDPYAKKRDAFERVAESADLRWGLAPSSSGDQCSSSARPRNRPNDTTSNDNQQTCGSITRRRRRKRIVEGQKVSTKYPSMAAVMFMGYITCGGTIISEQLVLTSAACVWNQMTNMRSVLQPHQPEEPTEIQEKLIKALNITGLDNPDREFVYLESTEDMTVGVGSNLIKKLQEVPVYKIHTQYKQEDITLGRYGMAILVLAKPLKFSDDIKPACLPTPDTVDLESNSYCDQLGYGSIEQNDKYETITDFLSRLQVPIRDLSECGVNSTENNDPLICAGRDKAAEGPCTGDVGGPLLCQDSDGVSRILRGVIKEYPEQFCSERETPTLYHDVQAGMDWIKDIQNFMSIFGGVEFTESDSSEVITDLRTNTVSCGQSNWLAYVYQPQTKTFIGVGVIIHDWWILINRGFSHEELSTSMYVYFGPHSGTTIEVQKVAQDKDFPGFSLLMLDQPLYWINDKVRPVRLHHDTAHDLDCSIILYESHGDRFHPSYDLYQNECNEFDENNPYCVGDWNGTLKALDNLTPGPLYCTDNNAPGHVYLRALPHTDNPYQDPSCYEEEDGARGPQLKCNVTSAVALHSWIAATVFPYECSSQKLVLQSGYILSPGYPFNSRGNLDCEYTITAPHKEGETQRMRVHIQHVHEDDIACPFDYVMIRDASATTGTSHVFCGGHYDHTFKGHSVHIRFHTNSTGFGRSIKIEFEAVTSDTDLTDLDSNVIFIHQRTDLQSDLNDFERNMYYRFNQEDDLFKLVKHDPWLPHVHDEFK